jgi:hypothetical protein
MMHLRVLEIAGGFYHTVVLLRQRNSEVFNNFASSVSNLKDKAAYHNQYNIKKYTKNYAVRNSDGYFEDLDSKNLNKTIDDNFLEEKSEKLREQIIQSIDDLQQSENGLNSENRTALSGSVLERRRQHRFFNFRAAGEPHSMSIGDNI